MPKPYICCKAHALEDEADLAAPRLTGQHSRSHLYDPMESLAKRVSAKLEEGDYGGEVPIACSEDAIADITPDILSALLEKHPRPHPDSYLPSPPIPGNFIPFSEIFLSSIRSFPRGSAGGPDGIRPDGIRPQHLLDLTSALAELGGRVLLRALTNFANCVLRGEAPQSIKPILFEANLIPLQKKDGGIRQNCSGTDSTMSSGQVYIFKSHACH